jgi:ABC-type uncharacterized transport system permease subunit
MTPVERAPATIAGPAVVALVCAASLREMIRRRTFVFLFLVCSIPFVLSLIWRSWGSEHLDAASFFTNLVSSVYLQILVYLVALAFGVPTVHSEIQGRTITYLFTRPVNKLWVYAGRLLAVQITGGVLLAASLIVCFAMLTAGNFEVVTFEFIKAYLNHVVLVLLATVCVIGICAIFGTAFGRPIVWATIYCFGWEAIVSKFPSDLRLYTVNFHIRNLLFDDNDVVAGLMDFLRDMLVQDAEVSAATSVGALAFILVGAALLGGLIFGRREYVIS